MSHSKQNCNEGLSFGVVWFPRYAHRVLDVRSVDLRAGIGNSDGVFLLSLIFCQTLCCWDFRYE
jgi:hypothetical protein